jgi:hypothetical protein
VKFYFNKLKAANHHTDFKEQQERDEMSNIMWNLGCFLRFNRLKAAAFAHFEEANALQPTQFHSRMCRFVCSTVRTSLTKAGRPGTGEDRIKQR